MQRLLKLVVLGFWMGHFHANLFAQGKYWVQKNDTSALSHLTPSFCSEWLPYCSYTLTDADTKLLKSPLAMPTYESRSYGPSDTLYGFALEQIEADLLVQRGLNGKGVKVGIIDGGFLQADERPALSQHFSENRARSYVDYITPELPQYEGSKYLDDTHGSEVWSLIGGYNPQTKVLTGIATRADYYLARTDHGAFEKRMEEDLLIQALEDMHKQGVRIVNVSLGYADGYTRKNENYTPLQMDGKTSLLSQAVDTAYFHKNMLIVVSAGNEGNRSSWKVLSTPGDAEGALTVGASVLNGRSRMKYSSIGTPGLSYIKPEVVCFASNGTSYSAPVVTGLAAALLQYDSTLTSFALKQLIMQSSTLYPHGNNHLGYGVPKVSRLLALLEGDALQSLIEETATSRSSLKLVIKEPASSVTVIHKNKEGEVLEWHSKKLNRTKIKVRRPANAAQSTVLGKDQHTEIVWSEL